MYTKTLHTTAKLYASATYKHVMNIFWHRWTVLILT